MQHERWLTSRRDFFLLILLYVKSVPYVHTSPHHPEVTNLLSLRLQLDLLPPFGVPFSSLSLSGPSGPTRSLLPSSPELEKFSKVRIFQLTNSVFSCSTAELVPNLRAFFHDWFTHHHPTQEPPFHFSSVFQLTSHLLPVHHSLLCAHHDPLDKSALCYFCYPSWKVLPSPTFPDSRLFQIPYSSQSYFSRFPTFPDSLFLPVLLFQIPNFSRFPIPFLTLQRNWYPTYVPP